VMFTALAPLDSEFHHSAPNFVIEVMFEIVFVLDLILRYCISPSTWAFMTSYYSYIDLLVVAPLPFRAATGINPSQGLEFASLSDVILLCVVPTARLLKLLRYFEQLRLLVNAFWISFEALPTMLFVMTLINLSFAAVIYGAEPRSNVQSWQHAIWFCLVTMTTVGYGDVYPSTSVGHAATSGLIVVSMLFMAIPIGIIGSTFQHVWESRDRILLIARTHQAMCKWGYEVTDHSVECCMATFRFDCR